MKNKLFGVVEDLDYTLVIDPATNKGYLYTDKGRFEINILNNSKLPEEPKEHENSCLPEIEKRKKRTGEYILYNIDDASIQEFDNMMEISRLLDLGQLHQRCLNIISTRGVVIAQRYRLFTKTFYESNLEDINKMCNILNKSLYNKHYHRLRRCVCSKAFPEVSATNKILGDKIGISVERVRQLTLEPGNKMGIKHCYTGKELKEMATLAANKEARGE